MIGYRIGPRGEYLGEVELKMMPSGEPICPPGIILTPPPEQLTLDDHHALVYRDGWKALEDNRVVEYWLAGDKHDTAPRVMLDYGELPEGALTEWPAEPTELEKWLETLEGKSAEELRSHLYSSQRYRFIDDDITQGKSDIPMCILDGKSMTVDEASQYWLRYVGDDDAKAEEAMAQKTAAKAYIRTAVAAYKEE